MRFTALFLSITLASSALAASSTTALKASKALPKGEAKRIARIEAHEGSPEPQRWHFLVHSPANDTGLTEYVIEQGNLISTSAVSQFVESLAEGDVIGRKSIQVDSDRLVKIATDYAEANALSVHKFSYHLSKSGDAAKPAWTIRAIGEAGEEVGSIVVSADKGKVLSHEGFTNRPSSSQERRKTSKKVKLTTEAEPEVAADIPALNPPLEELAEDPSEDLQLAVTGVDDVETGKTESVSSASSRGSDRKVASSRRGSRRVERSRGRDVNPVSAVRSVTRPVRRIVRSVLPF